MKPAPFVGVKHRALSVIYQTTPSLVLGTLSMSKKYRKCYREFVLGRWDIFPMLTICYLNFGSVYRDFRLFRDSTVVDLSSTKHPIFISLFSSIVLLLTNHLCVILQRVYSQDLFIGPMDLCKAFLATLFRYFSCIGY